MTGHSNGTIALWGLLYPSDIEHERRARAETESSAVGASPSQVTSPTALSSARTTTSARPAVRIGVEQTSAQHLHHSAPSRVVKAVPTCQLFIMKLLLDHRASVTALTLGADQRQLLSGDADGNCIRWVDDSISTNIL